MKLSTTSELFKLLSKDKICLVTVTEGWTVFEPCWTLLLLLSDWVKESLLALTNVCISPVRVLILWAIDEMPICDFNWEICSGVYWSLATLAGLLEVLDLAPFLL